MDFNEAALKERLETAVRGASPDVGALMDGGLERGARLRRRRRAQVLGAAGVTAAAVAAVAYAGIGQGLFDSDATGPANAPNRVVQEITEPATARSLVAAALEHLPADQVVGAGTLGDMPRNIVFASVGLDTDQGKVQLDLVASGRVKKWDKHPPCAASSPDREVVDCQVSVLADGAELIIVAEKWDAGPGSSTYLVRVGVRRPDQLVGVTEYLRGRRVVPQDENQPVAEWDLPVSVATMRDIVLDPRFGLLTSEEMVAEGDALDDFSEGGIEAPPPPLKSGTSGAVRVSPEAPGNASAATEPPPESVESTTAPERPGGSGSSSGP